MYQRRDRPDEIAHERPETERLGSAGHCPRHFNGTARLTFALDHGLEMLDGVAEAGIELVQLRHSAVVAGRYGRPPESQSRQGVHQARDGRHV